MALTQKQGKVLACILDHIEETGTPPTYSQIAHSIGVKSKSSISGVLDRLQERGYITRAKNRARAIDVVKLPDFPLPRTKPRLPQAADVGAGHVNDYGHCRDYTIICWDHDNSMGRSWMIAVRVLEYGKVYPACLSATSSHDNKRGWRPGSGAVPKQVTERAEALVNSLREAIK